MFVAYVEEVVGRQPYAEYLRFAVKRTLTRVSVSEIFLVGRGNVRGHYRNHSIQQ